MNNNYFIKKDQALRYMEEIEQNKKYDIYEDSISFLFKNSSNISEIEFEQMIKQLEQEYSKQIEILYYLALNSTNKKNILKFSNMLIKGNQPRLTIDNIILYELNDIPKKIYRNSLILLLQVWSEFQGISFSIEYIKQQVSQLNYDNIFELFHKLRELITKQKSFCKPQSDNNILMIPITLEDKIVLKSNGEIVRTKMMHNVVLTNENQVYLPKQKVFQLKTQQLIDNPYVYKGQLNLYGQYVEGSGQIKEIKLQNTSLDGWFYKGYARGQCLITHFKKQEWMNFSQGVQLINQSSESIFQVGYSYQQHYIGQPIMGSLDFGKWINQKMIDAYISYRYNEILLTQSNYLNNKFINFVITPSEFQDIFSSQLSLNSDPNMREWEIVYQKFNQKTNLNIEQYQHKNRFIFTICHERSHFIIIVGEIDTLYLIDSFDIFSNPHQFLMNFNQLLQSFPLFKDQYKYYYILRTMKKVNGYDCGIHCIQNAMKIIRNPDISVIDIDFYEQLVSKEVRFNLQNFFYDQ